MDRINLDKDWYWAYCDVITMVREDRDWAFWPWQKNKRRYLDLKISLLQRRKLKALARIRRYQPYWPE